MIMTTIVYDHKAQQIAVDSRTTGDGIILSDSTLKWVNRPDGSIWFLCGTVCDFDLLVEAVEENKKIESNLECNAFVLQNGSVRLVGVDDGKPWSNSIWYSRAIGTGFQFAISALDHGKTAKESVEYAATKDYCTGGKVHVYDIASAKFIE